MIGRPRSRADAWAEPDGWREPEHVVVDRGGVLGHGAGRPDPAGLTSQASDWQPLGLVLALAALMVLADAVEVGTRGLRPSSA